MLTTARHCSLIWTRWIQSTLSNTISLRATLISSHLCLGSPSGLFPSSHPTTTSYILLSHACCMPWPSHNPSFGNPNYIWWGVQIRKLLIMQFLQPPVTSSLFSWNIPLCSLFSDTLSVCYIIYNYTVLIFETVITLNLKRPASSVTHPVLN
jgi:hypothetical protein